MTGARYAALALVDASESAPAVACGRRRRASTHPAAPYTYVHVAPEFEWLDGNKHVEADPDYLGMYVSD